MSEVALCVCCGRRVLADVVQRQCRLVHQGPFSHALRSLTARLSPPTPAPQAHAANCTLRCALTTRCHRTPPFNHRTARVGCNVTQAVGINGVDEVHVDLSPLRSRQLGGIMEEIDALALQFGAERAGAGDLAAAADPFQVRVRIRYMRALMCQPAPCEVAECRCVAVRLAHCVCLLVLGLSTRPRCYRRTRLCRMMSSGVCHMRGHRHCCFVPY
jgi:hypothetical protein